MGLSRDAAESGTHGRLPLAAVVGLGVIVRLIFLFLTGELELWGDEAHYVQMAAMWSRFGFYMGCAEYLWPPLYPAYLTVFVDLFGEHGVEAAKVGQVLLSGVVGASIVLLAWRLFSYRAALIAGFLWADYSSRIGQGAESSGRRLRRLAMEHWSTGGVREWSSGQGGCIQPDFVPAMLL